MALTHQPMAFYRGDTWTIDAKLHYADGSPFNCGTGAQVIWTLDNESGATVLTLQLSAATPNGSAIAVITPPNELLLTIEPADAALPVGKYSDRVVAIDPSGFRSTQCEGVVHVKA